MRGIFAFFVFFCGWAQGQKEDRVPWAFSLSLRGWEAGAGQRAATGGETTGQELSPDLLLHATRDRLMGRLLYQAETVFDGQRTVSGTSFPDRLTRQDNELGLGYFWVPGKSKARNESPEPKKKIIKNKGSEQRMAINGSFQFWGGYKAMEIAREERDTPRVKTWRYGGWQLATTAFCETEVFGRFLDVELTAGYAILDARFSENRIQVGGREGTFLDPYSYTVQGLFLDAGLHLSLRPRLKWILGYKSQDYEPTEKGAPTTLYVPGFEPQSVSVATAGFSTRGWITGFRFTF